MGSSPYLPAIRDIRASKMNRSAFFLLLGLQLSYCMSINQTHSTASSNSSICTEALESASVVNLCKIYNWFGGLTNLFRKTGEVVSEIHGYGDEIQEFADYADISVDETVDYVVPILKEHIPTAQVQIAKILDGVPEVSNYISERIDDIPDEYRAQIGDGIVSLLEILPTTYIQKLRSGLEEEELIEEKWIDEEGIDDALRVLPSKKSMKGFLKVIDRLIEGDDWVPAAKDRVKERLDDVLKIVDNIKGDA